jgi:hypothetical protein
MGVTLGSTVNKLASFGLAISTTNSVSPGLITVPVDLGLPRLNQYT